METEKKLEVLAEAAKFDVCLSSCVAGGRKPDPLDRFKRWIYPVSLPDGRTTHILKILMSNACINACAYCANRAGRAPDVSLSPEELARAFSQMNRAGLVQGLFLSSAISVSPSMQMEKMVTTCEILRTRYRYNGYIHLKVLPGAPFHLIESGAQFADRMSINFETAEQSSLKSLAPNKNFEEDIARRANFIARLASSQKFRLRSHTTQFIVGATSETDSQLLKTAEKLITQTSMDRVYFSAFYPIKNTPLEDRSPTPLIREIRLYQAEFLLRLYGFRTEDLVFDDRSNLPTDTDVKLAAALAHPEWFPVDINTASEKELLRVPGIGLKTAKRLLTARIKALMKTSSDLKKVGVNLRRAAPFVLLSGKPLATTPFLKGFSFKSRGALSLQAL
ncbi:MAG: radical SAM protein [Planctomycetota bacterium]|nr:radical SAM protein [Planctomycetota bacterium]